MPLHNAGTVTPLISAYRLLWIGGRFGGHKTSLAFYLAKPYLEQGYRLITNIRSVWSDDLDKIELDQDGKLRAVVILDEGGLEFKASRQVEMIAAYARKMDVIYIIPSFWPPTRSAQVLTIQPIFGLLSAGVPAIVYRWRVRLGAFEDKGWFVWSVPSEIYGIYSTVDPGDTSSQIVSFLVSKAEQYRARFGYGSPGNGLSTLEGGEAMAADIFSDAVTGLQEAADSLASIPIRKGRRR